MREEKLNELAAMVAMVATKEAEPMKKYFVKAVGCRIYITGVGGVAWAFAFDRENGYVVRAHRTGAKYPSVELSYGPDGYYPTSASYPHTPNL